MKSQRGFSLVELLVVVIIIAIVAAIAIPNLLASRRAANEASAISSLRTYHSAEATYQATTGQGVAYASSTALGTAGLVDPLLGTASPAKSGYTYTVAVTSSSGTLSDQYCAVGTPTTFGTTGSRDFGVGIAGVIYGNTTTALLSCTNGVVTPGAGGAAIQ